MYAICWHCSKGFSYSISLNFPDILETMLSHSVRSDCDPMDCVWPAKLPSPYDSPGKNTGSRLPFPPPRDLPHPGIQLASPVAPALAGGFFTSEPSSQVNTNNIIL